MNNNIRKYLDLYPTRRLQDPVNIIMPVMNLDRPMFDVWSEVVQRIFKFTKYPYHLTFVINSDHDLTVMKAIALEKNNVNITAILNDNNAGFAKSCNQGFNKKYRYNLVFNSDVILHQEGWLESMVEVAKAIPDAGIVAPLVEKGGIDSQIHAADKPDGKVLSHYHKCPAVMWLVKRQCWLDVGGFDEAFWPGLYEDDVFQAKAKFNGWHIARDGRVWVQHLTNFTSKQAFTAEERAFYKAKNLALFRRKISAMKGRGFVDDPVWLMEKSAISPYFREVPESGSVYNHNWGLDICCGPRKSHKQAVGFDRAGKAKDVTGNAANLPFATNRFNWASALHAIEHFEDTTAVLQEWARVVKPGGYLCLIIPHKDRTEVNPAEGHSHEFLPSAFRKIVEAAGIGKIVQFNTLFNKKWSFDCVIEVN